MYNECFEVQCRILVDEYKNVVFQRHEYRLVFKPYVQNLLYVLGGFFGRFELDRLVFVVTYIPVFSLCGLYLFDFPICERQPFISDERQDLIVGLRVAVAVTL